jgi:hypothetical protein
MYFLFIFSWWDDGASICSRASDFDCHSSRPVTPSRQGRTKVQFEVSQYVLYGNMGCRDSKEGIQNKKDFALKVNIIKRNY